MKMTHQIDSRNEKYSRYKVGKDGKMKIKSGLNNHCWNYGMQMLLHGMVLLFHVVFDKMLCIV